MARKHDKRVYVMFPEDDSLNTVIEGSLNYLVRLIR